MPITPSVFPKKQVPAELLRTANRQGGVLTYAQSMTGLGRAALRRLISTGEWVIVTPGIVMTDRDVTDVARLWAGHLLGGPNSALGGRAALFLSGIGEVPQEIEVWVPPALKRRDRPGWVFHRDGLGRLDRTLGTLPRIRAEESLIDVGQGLGVEGWVDVLSESVRKGKVALNEVLNRIDRRPALANRALLRDVTLDLQGIESTLEWVYLTEVERAHGLPEGRRQARVTGPWRCDVHYDGHRLVVEVDGQLHLKRIFRDLERDNDHALRDEATLRYGSVDLRGRPCRSAWQVGLALQLRGWSGEPAPCPECPPEQERRTWFTND